MSALPEREVVSHTSRELWSMRDMLMMRAAPFLSALNILARLAQHAKTGLPQGHAIFLKPEDFDSLQADSVSLSEVCVELSLTMSASSAGRLCGYLQKASLNESGPDPAHYVLLPQDIDRIRGAIDELSNRLPDELASKTALVLPADMVQFYEPAKPIMGAEFAIKFTDAQYDLDEATKCLAFGRYTATVFHLMRMVEILLFALHACLNISTILSGNDRNWGNVLNRIRDAIASKGSKWNERNAFQEMFALLGAVKDAWRNSTMHVEKKYTDEECVSIFNAVRDLAQKVARRMDETGKPLA